MMTQNQLKLLFSQYSGYVYQYQGLLPQGATPQDHIVDQFITAADRVNLAVSLVHTAGVYLLHSTELISAESFGLIADLGYQEPVPESLPGDDSTIEPQGDE